MSNRLIHFNSGVVERYERLDLSMRKGNDIKDRLIKLGIVDQLEVLTRQGRVILLQFTNQGEEFLKKSCKKLVKILRYGGLLHDFWKAKSVEYFQKKGYQIEIEAPIGMGRTVDIKIQKENKPPIAVEIETGKSDAIGNINKCIDAGFKEVISIHTNRKSAEKIKEDMEGIEDAKITVIHTSIL